MADTPDMLTRLWLTALGKSWQPEDATAQYPYTPPSPAKAPDFTPRWAGMPTPGIAPPAQPSQGGLDTGHSALTDILRALQGPTYDTNTIPRGEPVQDTLYNNLNPDPVTAAAGARDPGNIYSAAFWQNLFK